MVLAGRLIARSSLLPTIVLGLLAVHSIVAQQLMPLRTPQPLMDARGITFGVDKIANTFLFTGIADIDVTTDVGTFRFVNSYRGSAFRTTTTALRDDQFANVSWSIPVSPTLAAIVRNSWTVSRDNRSVGLSSLERLNGALGARWQPASTVDVDVMTGMERTSQLGIGTTGALFGLDANLRDLTMDDWQLTSRLLADYHRMDALRTNSDVIADASIVRALDEGSDLRVAASYSAVGREYFTTLALGAADVVVESRGEERVNIDAALRYAITPTVVSTISAQLQSASIDRRFGAPAADAPITSINRRLSELMIDLDAAVVWSFERGTFTVGGALYRRDEQNGVVERFAIEPSALASLRSQENQRDNATRRSRMNARLLWTPSQRDTVEADLTSWLLRYDTPSDLNPDDRDELTTIAAFRVARRVSSGLSVGVTLAGQQVHLVFLKAERSALNNQNRVLRLAPYLTVQTSVLTMRPQLEVLANYTVYDFESAGATARSFSFRQIAWRDSIRVRLGSTMHAEGQMLLRYSERATLFWQQFAEAPETGQREWLAKILIFSSPLPRWSVGAGIRRYELVQQPLGSFVVPGASASLRFWAPEVAVRIASVNGSTLTMSGWFEFQEVNVTGRRDLPNLLLTTRVFL